jgi:serine/threonine-protein kinase
MSMVEKSAEEFARRAFDLNLLDQRQLESVWAELGTRSVSAEELQRALVRRGLLTNYQVDRLARGDKTGFFYGDYKVLYLVGTGSFARVYRAVHTGTGKVVAVKVLRKRFSEDPAATEQFVREGEMGAKLRHPNIVPIYEVHSDRRAHFMVMDFIEGRNLREFVRVRKKLSADEAIKFSIDIAAGLAYAAEHGIRHRDLKLSNVLMSSTGRAQLVDFGLAAVTGSDEEFGGDTVNPRTIDYAGLERATGVRKDDPRSDIYFAGCILYHMLTGRAPLVETKDRTQRLSKTRFESIVPITQLEPKLPQRVAMVVNKAMELNVNRRYQSPAEYLADLRVTQKRMQSQDNGNAASSDEGNDKAVMIVDSNPNLQDAFREGLKRVGYRVLVLSDPARALDRCDTDEHVADCVVFGCHSLGKTGLAAFNRFAELARTKHIPAILLIAEKQGAFVDEARLNDHRVVAKMPLKMGEFRVVLKQLLSAHNGQAS